MSHKTPSFNKRPLPVSTWIVSVVVFLLVIQGAATRGFPGMLAAIGVSAFCTGLYTVITKRKSWALLSGRKPAAILLTAGLAAMIIFGAMPPSNSDNQATPKATTKAAEPAPAPLAFTDDEPEGSEAVTAPAEPAAVATADTTTTSTTAQQLLTTLPVKGRAPKTGYDREVQFGTAWTDVNHNGCDTRNDILVRDLTNTTTPDTCKIINGTLVSPYTNDTIAFIRGRETSAEVQIDHVVSLSNAWQTGAQQLTQAQRVSFANDPINLLAVDGESNVQKGDGDAATWLPANKAFRCSYAARQVSVKATYGLWVTQAEHDALSRELSKCPAEPALTSEFTPAPAPAPAPEPTPEPQPEQAPPVEPVPASTYYENCDAVRAAGAAPISAGQPGYSRKLDRDGDGVACE